MSAQGLASAGGRSALGRLATTLGALASHWRRRPGQLAALLVGLAAATALWSGVQALNAEARASYERAAGLLGGAEVDTLTAVGGGPIDEAAYGALRRAGWAVSPVLDGRVRLALESGVARLRLLGIDPVTAPSGLFGGEVGARIEAAGGIAPFLTPPGRALIAPATLERLGLVAGEAPRLATGEALPPLVAAPGLAPDLLVMDIGPAQAALGAEGRLSRLLIAPDAPEPAADLATALAALPETALTRNAGAAAAGGAELDRLTESFHLNLTAFGLLAFLVGLFIAHAAAGLAFEQRKPLLRTLRATGVSARGLLAALLVELALLGLLAGALGTVGGYLIAGALLPDVAASLRGLYGAALPSELTLTPGHWLGGMAMCLFGALAAAGASLARAARLPLLATAQPAAWEAAERRAHRRQTAIGATLLAAAAALTAFGDGLILGFAGLAALLLGAALLAPPALAALLAVAERRLSRRPRHPLAHWALADMRQQLSSLSLALMALLLALAANIGVGTMVESFRTTFLDWLDQRLAAEAYVIAPTETAGAAMIDWARARPEVREVLPTARAEAALGGLPIELVGVTDAATHRETWPLLAAAEADRARLWDRLHAEAAALMSEQLARRLRLWTGDRLILPTPSGPIDLEVLGVYADYGNPRGQITLDYGRLGAAFPAAERLSFGVRLPSAATPAFLDALAATFGPDAAQIADQSVIKRYSAEVFDQTFAVTAALNTLTLGVAAIALFASLATSSGARIAALAPIWALGVARAPLAWGELGKTVALALGAALLAVPLGLLLAWHLLAVVNVQAFGWRLPLHATPGAWARLVLLATALAALAALPSVWRLARTSPATLARSFALER